MKMTASERRALDEAQDVGAVLVAVAGMKARREGVLPEDWDEAQYRAALSCCPAGRRVAICDFMHRYHWRVSVYDDCRLIDTEFLFTQDGVSTWLAAHYRGTEAHLVNSYEEARRILQASMTDTRSRRARRQHATVRLDTETLARIDALQPCFSTDWHQATVSDVLRSAILVGLKIVENEASATEKSPMPSGAEHAGRGASR